MRDSRNFDIMVSQLFGFLSNFGSVGESNGVGAPISPVMCRTIINYQMEIHNFI
jgi:hypothetical protein